METISGNISCHINATGDIRAKFSSVSGNVLLELANLKKVNLSAHSVSGSVQNLYREEEGYSAEVKVTTVSGDVRELNNHDNNKQCYTMQHCLLCLIE